MEQLQQIFDFAVEAVMQASGLDFDALANCRSERCVVARVVLVDVLIELGMSEGDISLLSGMSQQRVNSLKNSARYNQDSAWFSLSLDDVSAITTLWTKVHLYGQQ